MPYKNPEKQKEAQKRSYEKNKNKVSNRVRLRRAANKELACKFKSSGCVLCEESDVCCLDFHHRDDEEKLDTIAQMIRDGVSEKKLTNEIAKCDVLCANCHREKHELDNKITHKTRRWLSDYKKDLKCKFCNKSGIACLDFHHKNSEEKLESISELARQNSTSVFLLLEEIAKCDVLCANCHRKTHLEPT